ncbi:hypothetical protein GKE82_05620 [Conexibacter sp. W3-3-2]|uniref:DUF6338 family protein n=1 Tax=Conexibacter sp. W3-3-2 TaxID=2675227 RepID=UPI0012B85D65|nr:DUF6338 family protein [Conexibacter sp. W3-3-2]MTD43798.1 hypothetical protein [Conexibacter sp. W3-3-2]
MAPQTGTAVLVIAAFVLPGFVTVLLRERTYHVRAGTDALELLLTALYYSAIIYATAAVGAVVVGVFIDLGAAQVRELYRGNSTLAVYTALGLFAFVIAPVLLMIAGKRFGESEAKAWMVKKLGLDPSHATRSGWEHFFRQRRHCLVRMTLADGRVIGGLFSGESMAGYSQHGQDIFLEERWILNDDSWFIEPSDKTLGLYVPGSQIVSLEVYDYPKTPEDAEEPGRGAAEGSETAADTATVEQ